MKQREIKFRAWDRLEQEMIYFEKRDYINFAIMSGQGLIPMQFTGLTDKNGVEIYENDLLKDKVGNIKICIFNDKYARYWLIPYKEHIENPLGNTYDWSCDYHSWKVIGNIHQNKDLLK